MLASVPQFPLAAGGGLFIAVMGLFVALGGAFGTARNPLLVAGAVLATAVLVVAGPLLQAGRPSALQLGALGGSIALEAVLVRIAAARFRRRGERSFLLALLVAVALHFVPMALAFGPACLVLALACLANVASAMTIFPAAPADRVWAIDGLLKIAVGSAMTIAAAG